MSQGADIHKVRVTNGEKQLRINVVHRDLVRSWRSGSSVAVYIDTDRDRTGPEYAFVGGTFEETGLKKKSSKDPVVEATAFRDDGAPVRIDGQLGRYAFDETGADRVEFMLAANAGTANTASA